MREKICGVYKITNLYNGMIYIGSSIDIYRRWYQHKRELRQNIHNNKHLQNSWNLYGEEAFIFEIIERCLAEDKLKREQYYICETKCYMPDIGYNVQQFVVGGEYTVGENSVNAKYTDDQVRQVVELLQNPDLSYTEIAEKTKTSVGLVDGVFTKRIWAHLSSGIDFPYRSSVRKLDKEKVEEIIQRLLNNERDDVIAIDYGVSAESIQNIRLHKTYKKYTEGIDFNFNACRGEKSPFSKLTDQDVIKIINMYNELVPINIIAHEYNVKNNTITSILQRRTWKELTSNLFIREYHQSHTRITEEIAINILRDYYTGMICEDIIDKYNIGYSCLDKLIRGKTWKRIDRSVLTSDIDTDEM